MIPPLTSFDKIAGQYDAFLVDVFGVLFDGQMAYPQALETLVRLKDLGKPVILFSNSGKRTQVNIDRIAGHGIHRKSFQALLSSGEVAFNYLGREIGRNIRLNAKVWFASRGGDKSAITGLPLTLVDNPDHADLIFLAGCDSETTPLNTYIERLRGAAARGVPCLCSNPDRILPLGGGFTYGAGQIAQAYADLGGSVDWIGKPYPLMYDTAFDLLNRPARDRILCIGDSPWHDILGGQQAGFSTALVRTGIHAAMSDTELAAECQKAGAMPDHVLASFSFENASL